jgi:hypothetical protein
MTFPTYISIGPLSYDSEFELVRNRLELIDITYNGPFFGDRFLVNTKTKEVGIGDAIYESLIMTTYEKMSLETFLRLTRALPIESKKESTKMPTKKESIVDEILEDLRIYLMEPGTTELREPLLEEAIRPLLQLIGKEFLSCDS